MPLTAGQLSRQRARAARDLVDSCEIHRYTEITNSLGERVKTWALVASGVACRVSPVNAVTGQREGIRLDALSQTTNWIIALPYGQDVSAKDRLYVTTASPVRAFNISMVLAPHSEAIRARILAEEVS